MEMYPIYFQNACCVADFIVNDSSIYMFLFSH